MHILVSRHVIPQDWQGYMLVKTEKEANEIKGIIGLLVLDGRSAGQERKSNAPSVLPELVKKATKVVYVADRDTVDEHLKLLIAGAKGIYLDSAVYLKNKTTLETVLKTKGIDITNLSKSTFSTDLVSSSTIDSVLDSFSNAGDTPLSPQSRDLLIRTVKNYSAQVEIYAKEKQLAAQSALDYAEENSRIFHQITEVNRELKSQVEEMENLVRNGALTSGMGNRISVFPKYTLDSSKLKSHIKVKKIGNGVFCLSFVLGLRAYLERKRNLRSQVVVLVPETRYFQSIYNNYPWITSISNKDGAVYTSEIVFVSYPTKQVLNKLVDNNGYFENIIFLDMMTQDTDHLVKSRKKTWYFSSSPELIKRLHLTISNTIFSLKAQDGAAFSFKSWGGYPSKVGDRERAYIEQMGSIYSTMYETSY